MERKSIALVSTYTHPTRDSVEAMLRAAFPEFELDNFSIFEVARRHREWIVPNLLHVMPEYAGDILTRRRSVHDAYMRTPYLLKKIHGAMQELITPERHAFSFQTQSMYDTSVPGVPHFLYTDHTHLSNLASPHFDRSQLRSPEWIALEKQIYENASCVFTRSNHVSDDLARHYGIPSGKIECVYAGSNINVPGDYTADNNGYSNQNILFVGEEWERKGGPILVAAFRQILTRHPGARLTIVGASPVMDLPNCTVVGKVPLADLTRHYANASIFCLPTRLEPFGIAFLEAMFHRLPVVGTATGAVTDMINHGTNGLLVEPDDIEGLATSLTSLLDDPSLCRRMGEAGEAHALERYTWKKVGERIRARIQKSVRL